VLKITKGARTDCCASSIYCSNGAPPPKRAALFKKLRCIPRWKLIRSDSEFDTLSESCVFPDHPHKRPSEHFVDLPRDSKGLMSDKCPTAPKCALTAILNDSKIVASKDAKQAS